jgi:hypothetical protein
LALSSSSCCCLKERVLGCRPQEVHCHAEEEEEEEEEDMDEGEEWHGCLLLVLKREVRPPTASCCFFTMACTCACGERMEIEEEVARAGEEEEEDKSS